MILEVMLHQYLVESTDEAAEKVRQFTEAVGRRNTDALAMLKAEQVDPAALREALGRIEEAAAALAKPSEPSPTVFPREAAASQMQSILQRYFISHGLTQKPDVTGALNVTHPISDISLVPGAAGKAPDQLFGAISQTDAGWLACLAAKTYRVFGKRHPLPDSPADPVALAPNARVYLLADWGSGVSRAKKIADRVKSMIDAETQCEQHVIHLGDVYYSGWPEEYDDHFLAHWPVAPGQENRCGSWCLNANHDMFSGGYGYFDHLLKDARFARQQGRSVFSLENEHWRVFGLDSAWQDEDLAGDQIHWVGRAMKPGQKLVLLTHHQPFSAFEHDCVKLQPLLGKHSLTAWFWGHEHRFVMYKPRPDLPFGRLIGHAGVPVWARSKSKPVPDSVQYVSTRGFRSGIERFALFGFAVLDFEGSRIGVRYFDEHGSLEESETIS